MRPSCKDASSVFSVQQQLHAVLSIIIIIIHALIMRTHSVVMLNERCRQSLGGQYGKGSSIKDVHKKGGRG